MEPSQTTAAMNVAVAAAREAGKCITQSIDQLDQVEVKQKNRLELVSEIDVIAEKMIVAELDRAYPEFNVIGEECGDLGRDSEYCWIIDPIDGTHNFLHAHPHCAVSIALKFKDDVVVAVVYDAIRNELFTARDGRGAHLDGRRIRVSRISKLSQSLLVTGFPYRDVKDTKPWLKTFALVLPRAQSIHRTGSSVLDFAYVAAGRYDGFWEFGLHDWDIAAGAFLVKEAGGLVTDLTGNTDLTKSGNIIAGNPAIHEKLSYLISNQA